MTADRRNTENSNSKSSAGYSILRKPAAFKSSGSPVITAISSVSKTSRACGRKDNSRQISPSATADDKPHATFEFSTVNLYCPHCSGLIVEEIRALPWVKDVSFSLAAERLVLTADSRPDEDPLDAVLEIISRHEPDAGAVYARKAPPADRGVASGDFRGAAYEFSTVNLTCPHCSGLIVEEIRALPWVKDVSFSLAAERLVITAGSEPDGDPLDAITSIIAKHEPDAGAIFRRTGSPSRDTDATGEHSVQSRGSQTEDAEKPKLDPLLKTAIAIYVPALALYFLTAAKVLEPPTAALSGFLLAAWLLSGFRVMKNAVRKCRGNFFSEEMLMSIASLGAVASGEYPEAGAVMILYRIGEHFENLAVNRSRSSVKSLLAICPDSAILMTESGEKTVAAGDVKPGDRLRVRPGDRICCDAQVLEGTSDLDTSSVTGEALPESAGPGSLVRSGTVCLDGVLTVRAIRSAEESTASRIVRMVEDAGARKAPAENFITVFARWYTPAVLMLAALLSLIPILCFDGEAAVWIRRSLVFLVVSCPCALVISVPLSYCGGIGMASRIGLVLKGGKYLDALCRAKTVCFDKTGTLTSGTFQVTELAPETPGGENHLLAVAAAADSRSSHPAAAALAAAAGARNMILEQPSEIRELPGMGVTAIVGGHTAAVGNLRLMRHLGIEAAANMDSAGTTLHVTEDGRPLGRIVIADTVKASGKAVLRRLKEMGLRSVMLTGDGEKSAARAAGALGLEEYHHTLLPRDKADIIERIRKGSGMPVVFVGDGINDAPALTIADVGIAVAGSGADAAVEAADGVLLTPNMETVASAVEIARKTRGIVWQNIIFALAVKAALLLLGASGVIGMWMAVFGDVGVLIIAIMNAMRLMLEKTPQPKPD